MATNQNPTTNEQVRFDVTDEDVTAAELIDECESLGQLKSLDQTVINRTETDEGRIRQDVLRTFDEADDICWIEAGDTIAHNYGETTEILDIGPDLSDVAGMHVSEGSDTGESTVHLKLIQRWLRKSNIVVVGVRTEEFAEVPDGR